MKRKELMSHIGSVEQVGGVREFTFSSGKARGMRGIEIDTGNLVFTVLPDRSMDIATAKFKGQAVSWISKTGLVAPEYYDKEGFRWLRSFTGGLITTCGLRNLGTPVGEHGLHGRIANTPAEKVSVDAFWEGDEYIMKATGEMREVSVFGENLVLKREITAKLFCDEILVQDTVTNEGFKEENTALCYHCNFGYPLVSENSKLINLPAKHSAITAPDGSFAEECICLDIPGDVVTVGIENETIGAYITYKRNTLPDFMLWRMLGNSEYVVGLEPRTTYWGGQDIIDNDAFVKLKPFEQFKTYVKFSFKELH